MASSSLSHDDLIVISPIFFSPYMTRYTLKCIMYPCLHFLDIKTHMLWAVIRLSETQALRLITAAIISHSIREILNPTVFCQLSVNHLLMLISYQSSRFHWFGRIWCCNRFISCVLDHKHTSSDLTLRSDWCNRLPRTRANEHRPEATGSQSNTYTCSWWECLPHSTYNHLRVYRCLHKPFRVQNNTKCSGWQ